MMSCTRIYVEENEAYKTCKEVMIYHEREKFILYFYHHKVDQAIIYRDVLLYLRDSSQNFMS